MNPFIVPQNRKSYRFGTTWQWVHDDISFLYCETNPLMCVLKLEDLSLSSFPFILSQGL